MRSKSGLTIADMPYTMGITYHYEEETVLKDVPDFVIYVRSGIRFVILENFGRRFDQREQNELSGQGEI